MARSLSDIAFVTRRRRCGWMRDRRPGKTGGVFAGIHRGFFEPRTTRRLQIVRRSRTVNVGQAPKREMPLTWLTKAAGLREAPRTPHRMASRSI